MTSKKIQKEFVINHKYLSGIYSLYDDEDVCNVLNCELYKTVQPIERPTKNNDNYDEYSAELKNIVYEFLFGDTPAIEVLKKVEDITKIYFISLNNNDSIINILFFIITIVILCIIVFSTVFIFIPKFKPFFKFLPNDLWIVSMIGLIMIININFTYYGEITIMICHLRLILLSIGFSLNIVPVIYKLIVNFPIDNKVSLWVKKHPYVFLSVFIFIDIIMNLLIYIKPYTITKIRVVNGQNFQICELDNKIIEIIFILIKFLIFFVLSFLIFIEWSMKNIYYDIRFFTAAIYIDILDYILIIMINFFKITNYKYYFVIKEIIFIIYAITNYVFLFGYRIIYCIFSKRIKNANEMDKIINIIRKNSKYTSTTSSYSNTVSNNSDYTNIKHNTLSRFSTRIINFHNQQEKNVDSISDSRSDNIFSSNILSMKSEKVESFIPEKTEENQ